MKRILLALAALFVAPVVHAFTPIQYVQISTITASPTLQHGAVSIDSGTVSSFTVTNQITFPNASTQTVSGQFGRLVQIKCSTTTASTTSSGTAFTLTTSTVTINMKNAADWVKITVTGELGNSSVSTTGAYASIFKNAANFLNNIGFCTIAGTIAGVERTPCSLTNLWDQPGTVSGTAYTVYIRSDVNADATWTNDNGTSMICVEEYTPPNGS